MSPFDDQGAVAVARTVGPATSSGSNGAGTTSVPMKRVQKLVEQSAASDVPVLITGEVGVGKDLIAGEIHRRSARADRAMTTVKCASLPQDFFESSLANLEGGTLFLDEISELSRIFQEKLLQLLRQGDIARIGNSGRQPIDFRLIGATRRDLSQLMQQGSFSEELYYRVNLIHIHVPPLRAHPEDIPALLQHFMQEHGRSEGWHEREIPENMLARFRSYEWPGNVRELENAVRRLIALRDPAYVLEELEAQSQMSALRPSVAAPLNGEMQSSARAAPHDGGQTLDLKELGRRASDLAERAAIVDMLSRTSGSKKETAQRLGISYKALLYKIHDFGIAASRTSRPPPPLR